MRSSRGKRGQFVIIAVMLSAIMIVTIGALMHGASTYYKHEPWEEYSTLIGDIEINSRKIVELSLASYTNSAAQDDILDFNLEKWRHNLPVIYPSKGLVLTPYNIEMGGMEENWYKSNSISYASAEFNLSIRSIGLEGYTFKTVASLNLKIISDTQSSTTDEPNEILIVVNRENGVAITDLDVVNFQIEGASDISVTLEYDASYICQYRITHDSPITHPQVKVCDQRGISVVGVYSVPI